MTRISGVVIALNEAAQLHYALGTLLPWCDEVIVVDQHSDDETAAIAERMGATVFQHERTGGIADPARRFAVSKASGDWVLILDADEMVPPTLAARLRRLADSEAPYDVVLVPRANVILGRWLRFGNNWPARHARFFRPGALLLTDRIHKSIVPAPGTRRLRLPAEAGLAMHDRRDLPPQQRPRATREHLGVGTPGQLAEPAGVRRRQLQPDIACDGGEAEHLQLRRCEGKQDGDGVIQPRIRIDDDSAGRHSLTSSGGPSFCDMIALPTVRRCTSESSCGKARSRSNGKSSDGRPPSAHQTGDGR